MKEMKRDGEGWFHEGQLLMRKGEHDRSADAFTQAMAEGWNPEVSYLSRGVANLLAKHHEKAYDDFTEALKIDGLNVRALFYRGSASVALEHYARAIGDFTRALEVDPDYGTALLNRGFCYAQTGRYEEAVLDFKRALMAAETDAQHFADQVGVWRNHIEGVLDVLHQRTDLTGDEIDKLRAYFEE